MQRNWIGRSEGARVRFKIEPRTSDLEPRTSNLEPRTSNLDPRSSEIEVFTTRIDTIYGANFIVLAPEHPLVPQFADAAADPAGFRAQVAKCTSQDRSARMAGDVEKEGFDTRRRAINPFTGKPVPIWVANFGLVDYGTGAVMGVPGHDQRDFEFARKYGRPVTVVGEEDSNQLDATTMTEPHAGQGKLVNSAVHNELPCAEASR